jgi:hypothetical protein
MHRTHEGALRVRIAAACHDAFQHSALLLVGEKVVCCYALSRGGASMGKNLVAFSTETLQLASTTRWACLSSIVTAVHVRSVTVTLGVSTCSKADKHR